MNFPNWQREKWIEYPDNPIVGREEIGKPKAAIGDPQVLTPGQFDDKWHMFYHGFYDDTYTPYLHHMISDDGFAWRLLYKKQYNVNPTYLFFDKEAQDWILFYSAVLSREEGAVEKYGCVNIIRAKRSKDLMEWGEDIDILLPTLDWEREHDPSQKNRIEARNPCLVRLPNGRYRLYYSAGTVKLQDCGYEEPKYISYAESDSPLGPYKKLGRPIIAPDSKNPFRNLGAGAIKVYSYNESFLGLYNSIYVDELGYSRSAINLLLSKDGENFEEAPFNPIILPTGRGWNSDLVYQLDLVRWGDELRLYYNAREGQEEGVERIGCSILEDSESDIGLLR